MVALHSSLPGIRIEKVLYRDECAVTVICPSSDKICEISRVLALCAEIVCDQKVIVMGGKDLMGLAEITRQPLHQYHLWVDLA